MYYSTSYGISFDAYTFIRQYPRGQADRDDPVGHDEDVARYRSATFLPQRRCGVPRRVPPVAYVPRLTAHSSPSITAASDRHSWLTINLPARTSIAGKRSLKRYPQVFRRKAVCSHERRTGFRGMTQGDRPVRPVPRGDRCDRPPVRRGHAPVARRWRSGADSVELRFSATLPYGGMYRNGRSHRTYWL